MKSENINKKRIYFKTCENIFMQEKIHIVSSVNMTQTGIDHMQA